MTLPERSFSIALEETKFFPILRITPSLIKTSLFSKVPLSVAVCIFAFFKSSNSSEKERKEIMQLRKLISIFLFIFIICSLEN